MRFLTSTLTLLLAFISLTHAYVENWVSNLDNGFLDVYIYDNGAAKCVYQGQYVRGTQRFLNCVPGFASWINIPAANPQGAVQAYAYGGQNFKWAVPLVRSFDRWTLLQCLFGPCPRAALRQRSELSDNNVARMTEALLAIGNGTESATVEVPSYRS